MRTRRKTYANAEILPRGLIVQSRTLALLGRRHLFRKGSFSEEYGRTWQRTCEERWDATVGDRGVFKMAS